MARLDTLAAEAPDIIESHWRTTKDIDQYGFAENAEKLLTCDIDAIKAKYKPRGLVKIEFLVDLDHDTQTGRSVGSLTVATAVLPKG